MRMNRRQILAAGVAAGIATAGRAFGHDTSPIGAWTPVADMPFPAQEIYPAPFWKAGAGPQSLKPTPFNIIVNAGGLVPDAPNNVSDRTVWYDPAADQWGYGTPLPAPRHHLMLVNNNGYLYGIGGFARDSGGGWRMRPDCWRLDDVNGAWTPRRPMPHPQAESVCQSLGGFIHVVGGRAPSGSRNRDWSDHIDTDEHWIYDAALDRWVGSAPMPTPRNSAAGAVLNGVLYVIGGRTVRDGNTSVVEVYDPLSDRWEKARPMPKAQGGLAAAALNGKIYVFGGEYFNNGRGVFADAWEYDPRKDRWRAVAAMPRARHGLGAVTIRDSIYVIGGAAKAGGEDTTAATDQFTIAD
jgi:hypothetical protein